MEFHVVPVIEAGTLQCSIVHSEPWCPDDVQRRSRRGAQTCDVTGVRRDFRLDQRNMKHILILVIEFWNSKNVAIDQDLNSVKSRFKNSRFNGQIRIQRSNQDSELKIQEWCREPERNPRPKTQDPRSKIQVPRSKIQDPRSKVQDQRSKFQDPRPKIQNPKSKIKNRLTHEGVSLTELASFACRESSMFLRFGLRRNNGFVLQSAFNSQT